MYVCVGDLFGVVCWCFGDFFGAVRCRVVVVVCCCLFFWGGLRTPGMSLILYCEYKGTNRSPSTSGRSAEGQGLVTGNAQSKLDLVTHHKSN